METQKPKSAETLKENDHKPVFDKTKDANKPIDKTQEIGGVDGLEPTRYGDWENNGRCTDF